ncbi:hypothetical protein BBP40_002142 [Aspergillus hancockii]|nr:hypothetical protein BBP40_002142 [Aspergillus hancockii]
MEQHYCIDPSVLSIDPAYLQAHHIQEDTVVARNTGLLPTHPDEMHAEGNPCIVAVDCLFAPHCDYQYISFWAGPNILSPLTNASDIFDYLSVILPTEPVSWLEIHLLVVQGWTGEAVSVLPFFLPRTESLLGNLARCQELIHSTIRAYRQSGNPERFYFQLVIHPGFPVFRPPITPSEGAISSGALDPEQFVENVSSQWSDVTCQL